MIPRSFARNSWRNWHLIGAVMMIVIGFLATIEAWSDLVRAALQHDQTRQIVLVPIAAAWLIWARRERLRMCEPIGNWNGPVFVVSGWLMWDCGSRYALPLCLHLGGILIVLGCFFAVVGRDVLMRFSPAVATLAFLLPAPWEVHERLAGALRLITTELMLMTYELIGIATDRHGALLTINGVDVPASIACQGVGFAAMVLVAYAFAFGTALRTSVRLLIILASPFAAVVCHVARVLSTSWVYGRYPAHYTGWLDTTAGWLILPVLFGMLAGIVKLLTWASVPVRRYTLAQDS